MATPETWEILFKKALQLIEDIKTHGTKNLYWTFGGETVLMRRYRVYLAKDGDRLIVLFGGGTKRGQQRDIDRAKALHIEYKARKKAAVAATKKPGKHKR